MSESVTRRELFRKLLLLGGGVGASMVPVTKLVDTAETKDVHLHGGLHLHGDHQTLSNVTFQTHGDGPAVHVTNREGVRIQGALRGEETR